jgi:hypothetical protein
MFMYVGIYIYQMDLLGPGLDCVTSAFDDRSKSSVMQRQRISFSIFTHRGTGRTLRDVKLLLGVTLLYRCPASILQAMKRRSAGFVTMTETFTWQIPNFSCLWNIRPCNLIKWKRINTHNNSACCRITQKTNRFLTKLWKSFFFILAVGKFCS